MPGRESSPPNARLDSWKEIAAYLRRSVRTVQRWEKSEGLPVHRHRHEKSDSVYAHRTELDDWWRDRRAPIATDSPCSICVLPFADLSPGGEREYLSDGITEEIINALAKLRGLRVAARTSAFAFKGTGADIRTVGRRLNVDVILEGTIRVAGERLRVTSRLTNVADGFQLWSERFDRVIDDVFAIQDEISQTIVETLKPWLGRELSVSRGMASAPSPEAYTLYLKGRYCWNQRTESGLRKAVTYFERALDLDRDFALAHAGLADAYHVLGSQNVLSPKASQPNAKKAALRALAIDEGLAEAHASLGATLAGYDWNWSAAEQAFQRSLMLNPSYATGHQWYAELLAALGRFDEATARIRVAEQLDPLSPVIQTTRGWIHYLLRDFDESVLVLDGVLEMHPEFGLAHLYLGLACQQLGRSTRAIEALESAVALVSREPFAVGALGQCYGALADERKAREILAELERARARYVSPYARAIVHTGLGELDEGLEWLDRARDERADFLIFANVEPMLDPLRSDPRFDELLKSVNLD